MAIGPVYWGSYNGEMLEKLMAVLISQEHDGVIRRTPSSGDGGVDLLIPDDDGWHVRQVKSYVGRMNSTRRREVENSFVTLRKDPRLKRRITRWSLTVPIDPTSDEQAWFESFTEGAPFPCYWDGEPFWHTMAARHSHVIDYYLHGGRQRVEDRAQRLLQATTSAAGGLSATDVAGHLELLRNSLNRDDPHYRYEFVTGPAACDPNHAPEECVMHVTTEIEDFTLMIQVFPKHPYALEDAPIGGTMNITIFNPEKGIDIREAFESFQTFGTGVDLPEGALDGKFTAPGGLGGEIRGGSGRIGPSLVQDPPERTRVRLVHPDEGATVEVGLVTRSATRGDLGGIEIIAEDETGLLSAAFRVQPLGSDPPLTFHLSSSSFAGRPIQEVMPAARLLGAFRPPMRFEWLLQYGNQLLAGQTMNEDLSLISLGELSLFEDLSVIQDHVRDTVIVPEEIPMEAVTAIGEVAHLIRQRKLSRTWEKLEINLKEGAARDEVLNKLQGDGSLAIEQQQVLQLGNKSYELGTVHYIYGPAVPADEQPDDTSVIRFVPGADNTMKQGLGPLPKSQVTIESQEL